MGRARRVVCGVDVCACHVKLGFLSKWPERRLIQAVSQLTRLSWLLWLPRLAEVEEWWPCWVHRGERVGAAPGERAR